MLLPPIKSLTGDKTMTPAFPAGSSRRAAIAAIFRYWDSRSRDLAPEGLFNIGNKVKPQKIDLGFVRHFHTLHCLYLLPGWVR